MKVSLNGRTLKILINIDKSKGKSQSGKSTIVDKTDRFMDLSEVDDGLDGYGLNLILTKRIKRKADDDEDEKPVKKKKKPKDD